MAAIRISRDSGYADRLRAYSVMVDGSEVGSVRDGEMKVFPVEAGEHTVRAKIDWAGSKTLTFAVGENEEAAFRVKSNLRGTRLFFALWYSTFGSSSYLLLEEQ